jgi:AcrR family transcriptional regulator
MKNEIIEVALKQFLKVGIREMSIQKLVDMLGISTKTVYKYFKNKEDLLEEALLLFYTKEYRMWDELSMNQSAVSLLLEIWFKAVQVEYDSNNLLFQDLRYYYPELKQKIEESTSKKFEAKFVQVIQNGIEKGLFQSELIPEVVMGTIYTLYIRAFRTDDFQRFHVSSYNLYLNTIVVYIKGLCTAKGVKEIESHIQTLHASGTDRRIKGKFVNQL